MIAFSDAYQKGLFEQAHWGKNLVSGIIVGIVALPLAMAFAIASGAKPEQGLYTAIVAGGLTSIFGGSLHQISGPTGAFIVILSGITAKYGIVGLQISTLLAGVILIVMGMTRLGTVIRFIPDPVIVGFTSGIAVIIWVGQWKDFFGLHPLNLGDHFHEKLQALFFSFSSFDFATTTLGLVTLALLILSPYVTRRVPAPLIALVGSTLLGQFFPQFGEIATIGSAFGGIPQKVPALNSLTMSLSDAIRMIGPAFTIALLGAIESLLSAVVADSMAGTRHDPNQELIGQGIANCGSALFGGFAATGALARTATNIRNGATGPLSGIIHALFLLLVVLVFAPLASRIPLCALSAILFVVAYNMSEWRRFIHLLGTAPKADVAVMAITFLLTLFSDLVIAVNIGVVLASLLFMSRMSEATAVKASSLSDPHNLATDLPPGTYLVHVDGPYFFGAAERLESTIHAIHMDAKVLILDFERVPVMDATGINSIRSLVRLCRKRHTEVMVVGLKDNIRAKLERDGLLGELGVENVLESVPEALKQIRDRATVS